MKNASELLHNGLNGHIIVKLLEALTPLKEKKPVAWFIVTKVLDRINDEWEEEILPIERADYIDKTFKNILIRVLNDIDNKSLSDIKPDLDQLIRAYSSFYA